MKNKTISKYTARVMMLLVFAIVGCNKDFLSDRPDNAIPLTKPISDLKEMKAALNGAYSSVQDYLTFGRNTLVIPDLVADNAFVSQQNSGRFLKLYNQTWSYENSNIAGLWSSLYTLVSRANLVIVKTEINPSDLSDSDKKLYNQYLGEAYALRAMAHFTLADFFAASPKTAQQTPGIPYVKTLVDPENPTEFKTPRLSLEDTYKAIEEDFNKALALFDKGDKDKDKEARQKKKVYLGPAAVQLLLSRLYLYNQQYSKAIAAAKKAEDLVPMVKKEDYVAYWQRENADVETVFEIEQDDADNNGSNSYSGILQSDVGYGQNLAYDALIQAMPTDDVRRGLFERPGEDEGRSDDPPGWYVNKYTSDTRNLKLLRISEAHLNRIEAEYHTGGDALGDLNKFAAQRSGKVYSSLTGTDLLNAILKERRFELCFEGHRLFDLRRNGRAIHRGANASASTRDLSFPSKRYYLPIPRIQMTSPNNEVEQNPEY